MSANVLAKQVKKEPADPTMRPCVRCYGRKKVYKIMGGYSLANSGGKEVDCPMCNGVGKHKKIDEVLKDIEVKESKSVEPAPVIVDPQKTDRNRNYKKAKNVATSHTDK